MILGVCDYPEQVPPEEWRDFPARMRAAGLSVVRLAEFAWSRLEPRREQFDFAWLDEAIKLVAGLRVILGTPTPAPPAWLVREWPEILSHDREGRPREFGSRRHADYASERWWQESARIVGVLARRYGGHAAVIGWQTDNEHGCHDTARSYSPAARAGFQTRLRAKYGESAALNAAWGTVFWSQSYGDFAEVGLPHRLPYTPNPSHVLDLYRYASERLVAYDRMQAEILRRHSPGRFVTHNSMPFFADFDHHQLAAHLDFVSVDHHPTGVLETSWLDDETKGVYARVGHSDLTGFTHDLYWGLKDVGHWVMEQPCGPTDWAGVNPQPERGAVRLWTPQAQAHGAEGAVYFRWPRSPLHPVSGLQARRPDALRPQLNVPSDGELGAHGSHTWNEALEVLYAGVTVLAAYQQGPLARQAAVTEAAHEAGWVTSVDAWSETLVRAALRRVPARAQVPVTFLPPGVRVSRRGAHTLPTNWGAQPAELSGPDFGHQLPPLSARVQPGGEA